MLLVNIIIIILIGIPSILAISFNYKNSKGVTVFGRVAITCSLIACVLQTVIFIRNEKESNVLLKHELQYRSNDLKQARLIYDRIERIMIPLESAVLEFNIEINTQDYPSVNELYQNLIGSKMATTYNKNTSKDSAGAFMGLDKTYGHIAITKPSSSTNLYFSIDSASDFLSREDRMELGCIYRGYELYIKDKTPILRTGIIESDYMQFSDISENTTLITFRYKLPLNIDYVPELYGASLHCWFSNDESSYKIKNLTLFMDNNRRISIDSDFSKIQPDPSRPVITDSVIYTIEINQARVHKALNLTL